MRLIDADALNKILGFAKNCKECKFGKNCINETFSVYGICTALTDALTIGGWISVKDKLPANGAFCLTYSPNGKMRVAEAFIPSSIPNSTYDKMECWWLTHGSGGQHFVAVTHWMPLPEPPKEE